VVFGGEGHKVGAYVHFTGKVAAIIDTTGPATAEVLANVGMHVVAAVPAPLGISEADLPADLVAKEKAIAVEEAKASGKPAEIAEKMAIGKLNKFIDSIALLRQPYVLDDKQQVKAILPKGVEVKAFRKFVVG
jgi:elongation factor Ts